MNNKQAQEIKQLEEVFATVTFDIHFADQNHYVVYDEMDDTKYLAKIFNGEIYIKENLHNYRYDGWLLLER